MILRSSDGVRQAVQPELGQSRQEGRMMCWRRITRNINSAAEAASRRVTTVRIRPVNQA